VIYLVQTLLFIALTDTTLGYGLEPGKKTGACRRELLSVLVALNRTFHTLGPDFHVYEMYKTTLTYFSFRIVEIIDFLHPIQNRVPMNIPTLTHTSLLLYPDFLSLSFLNNILHHYCFDYFVSPHNELYDTLAQGTSFA
jgi:hypothetical protein